MNIFQLKHNLIVERLEAFNKLKSFKREKSGKVSPLKAQALGYWAGLNRAVKMALDTEANTISNN